MGQTFFNYLLFQLFPLSTTWDILLVIYNLTCYDYNGLMKSHSAFSRTLSQFEPTFLRWHWGWPLFGRLSNSVVLLHPRYTQEQQQHDLQVTKHTLLISQKPCFSSNILPAQYHLNLPTKLMFMQYYAN